MNTTVRSPGDVIASLNTKYDITLKAKDLADLLGLQYPFTDDTVVGMLDEEIFELWVERKSDALDEERADEIEPVDEPESGGESQPISEPVKRQRPIRVVEFIGEYRKRGFASLRPSTLEEMFPSELRRMIDRQSKAQPKRLSGSMIMWSSCIPQLKPTLETLLTISIILERDRTSIEAWDAPDHERVANAARRNREIYYTAICGHKASISTELYVDRSRSDNSNVPALFYLCDTCRAQRAALLNMVPGAANPDSVCMTCGEHTFRGGNTDERAFSLARSRGDLYDNLIAEVMPIVWLPKRLNAEHRDDDPRHLKVVRTTDEFKLWASTLRAETNILAMKHPKQASVLKARLRDLIAQKRAELGIPDSVED